VNPVSRRNLLGLSALLLVNSSVRAVSSERTASQVFISAASDPDDGHWVRGFATDAQSVNPLFELPLPERGHHVAIHPDGQFFVAVARRPGTWLVLGNALTGELMQTITVPADRHLYGHGIFSADGSRFFTTESDFDDVSGDSGRIIVWSVETSGLGTALERIADFPSYGVGPHELQLMPDQQTVVIANGGIRTHPAHDRENLNIDTMLPSLAYVDVHSGTLLEQQFLPEQWHQASIRHLDVSPSGQVAMGMQFEGDAWQAAPLIATHRRGEPLRMLQAPEPVQRQMQQYVGSVRFARNGGSFGASCPRGNLVTFWDAGSGELLTNIRSRDGCGLCATDTGFVFTSGTGRIAHFQPDSGAVAELTLPENFKMLWDNHLSERS